MKGHKRLSQRQLPGFHGHGLQHRDAKKHAICLMAERPVLSRRPLSLPQRSGGFECGLRVVDMVHGAGAHRIVVSVVVSVMPGCLKRPEGVSNDDQVVMDRLMTSGAPQGNNGGSVFLSDRCEASLASVHENIRSLLYPRVSEPTRDLRHFVFGSGGQEFSGTVPNDCVEQCVIRGRCSASQVAQRWTSTPSARSS